jgi:uncharacterized protein
MHRISPHHLLASLPLLFILLAGKGLANQVLASGDPDALNLAVAERHIIPGYERLATATAELDAVARRHCNADGPAHAAVLAAYGQAFLAWQDVQHIRLGPIVAFGRDFRFQLWPDKRGSVGKHLAGLMADPDPNAIGTERFAAGSVALQGFGALERLLYDPPPDAADRDWHCRVVLAITGNLARMATDVLGEWRDGPSAHRHLFATASAGNTHYASADELGARLFNNLHTQLELLVEQKLGRPLGDSISRAMPKRAEAWRSGLSMAAVQRNLAAIDDLYRIGFAQRAGDSALHARFAAGLATARDLAGSSSEPLSQRVADPTSRPGVERLRDELVLLRGLVAGELSTALALPLGFNSLDGD